MSFIHHESVNLPYAQKGYQRVNYIQCSEFVFARIFFPQTQTTVFENGALRNICSMRILFNSLLLSYVLLLLLTDVGGKHSSRELFLL